MFAGGPPFLCNLVHRTLSRDCKPVCGIFNFSGGKENLRHTICNSAGHISFFVSRGDCLANIVLYTIAIIAKVEFEAVGCLFGFFKPSSRR